MFWLAEKKGGGGGGSTETLEMCGYVHSHSRINTVIAGVYG